MAPAGQARGHRAEPAALLTGAASTRKRGQLRALSVPMTWSRWLGRGMGAQPTLQQITEGT